MLASIEEKHVYIKKLAGMKFPKRLNKRMQTLMERGDVGKLTLIERDELKTLVDLSENMSLSRAYAALILGRELKKRS